MFKNCHLHIMSKLMEGKNTIASPVREEVSKTRCLMIGI